MDPKNNSTPGLHLPEPTLTQQAVSPASPSAPEVQAIVDPPQQTPPTPEPAIQHYQPPVQPLAQALPESVPPELAPVSTYDTVSATSVVQEGEDDSQDEKWTTKAREIAVQYRTDPYMQSRALSQLKAEYLAARHGKTLKTDNT